MNQEKPRNYYSLNLTEGRIFIIFISVLIIITILVFSIAFLISSNNKRNSNTKTDLDKEELQVTENDSYAYYDLNKEQQGDSFLAEDNNNDQEKENQSEEVSNKNDTGQKDFVEVKEIEKDPEIVKLDNNNVLYSSKHINEKDTVKVENKPQITKKTAPAVVHKNTENKKIEIRYTVQIGSYLEKKTAEEISLFYKIQGYPAYIIEKTTGGKRFYRLRVGPFKQKEDAEKYLTSLKNSKYGKDSSIWVVYL